MSNLEMLRKQLTINTTIWTVLLISIVLYIPSGYLLPTTVEVPPSEQILFFCYCAAGCIYLAIAWIQQPLRRPKPSEQLAEHLANYRRIKIFAWVLAEGVAILGFVAFMMGHSFRHFLTFVAVSVFYMMSCKPSQREFMRMLVNSGFSFENNSAGNPGTSN